MAKINFKPIDKSVVVEYESGLMRHIDSCIMSIKNNFVTLVHGLLVNNNSVITDIGKLIDTNGRTKKSLTYEFSFVPYKEEGVPNENMIIIDGVLEFLPTVMHQILFIKSMLLSLYPNGTGYIIIKNYSDDDLKLISEVNKLEPKGNGYLIDKPGGGKAFLKGLDKKDLLDIIGYGRIESIYNPGNLGALDANHTLIVNKSLKLS